MPEETVARQLPRRDMRRQNVRRTIVDFVKEFIFEGTLRAGDRVSQEDVAAALGVSNTPVREALIVLEHEGFVTLEMHRGAFVNAFDAENIRLQYELFALLWSWAVRHTVLRATDAQVEQLLRIGRATRDTTDHIEMYDLMTQLADVFEEVSGSHDWRRIFNRLPRLVPGAAVYLVPGSMEAASRWVLPTVEAIQRRDVETAVHCGDRMNYEHGESMIRELERRGLITPHSHGE